MINMLTNLSSDILLDSYLYWWAVRADMNEGSNEEENVFPYNFYVSLDAQLRWSAKFHLMELRQ